MTRARRSATAELPPTPPPVSIELEQAVLGAFFSEPSLLEIAVERFGLLPEHFCLERRLSGWDLAARGEPR